MAEFNSKIMDLIKKTCKGKKHIKLTAGILTGNEMAIKVFGESKEVENGNYIYETGSITKTFTASLTAKYIHENKLSLDDTILKFINDLDKTRYYPTLRRLATHTGGYSARLPLSQCEFIKLFSDMALGRNQGVIPFRLDFEKMKNIVKNINLQDKNYKWEYSNFGYILIGYIISEVSGKSYRSVMDEFLSEELGLNSTYTGAYADRNLCGFSTKNKECGNWDYDNNLIVSAGCISSTAKDLLTYAKINMYEEKPYLTLCHKKHANLSKKYDMGLGWWLYKKDNNIMQHEGGTGCFSTFLIIDKNKKLACTVLANYRLGISSERKIGTLILESLQ